ncbi:MAG TPA: glycosyltransferase family 87 protein [Gemmataceae bacterium]|nr:glycosyltransferase family 87 protein [Gemmataceae bacterium]
MSTLVVVSEQRRRWLVGAALTACAGLLLARRPQLLDPQLLGVADFVQYWAAGRLNLTGGNPYALEQMLPVEQAAGWKEDWAIPMWNPFWTMTLAMPFSALPFALARLLWLIVEFGIVLGCADFLWRLYRGSVASRWLAWAVALTFCPTIIVLRMGQLGPFQLLSLCLFLHLISKHADWGAGAVLALATVKPHLLLLFWIALGLWILSQRRWQVAAGAGCTLLLAGAVTLAVNPHVFEQYRAALAGRLASETLDYQAPTLGAFLRLSLGEGLSWVQYAPTVVGIAWILAYWWRKRQAWDWHRDLPLVLLVSYATALYGWLGDQVVLLVPVIQATGWLVRGSDTRTVRLMILAYALLDGIVLAAKVAGLTEAGQFWVAPALCAGYVLLMTRLTRLGTGPCRCVGTACLHPARPEGV